VACSSTELAPDENVTAGGVFPPVIVVVTLEESFEALPSTWSIEPNAVFVIEFGELAVVATTTVDVIVCPGVKVPRVHDTSPRVPTAGELQ
jgi:hypothetical protein